MTITTNLDTTDQKYVIKKYGGKTKETKDWGKVKKHISKARRVNPTPWGKIIGR